jgi:hypothetical protein
MDAQAGQIPISQLIFLHFSSVQVLHAGEKSVILIMLFVDPLRLTAKS